MTTLTKNYLLKGVLVFPPALLAIAPVCYLDNAWSVAKTKAKALGDEIGKKLVKRDSNRPLTIVAYSLGCLSVLSMLDVLYENRLFGVVQDGTLVMMF